MSAIIPPEVFRWKKSNDDFIYIDEMNTSYLFNTFRMIWNNTAPEFRRDVIYNRYDFSGFYLENDYLNKALRAMKIELNGRESKTTFMKNWLSQNNI